MTFPLVNLTNPGANIQFCNTPSTIAKRVTRIELTETTIQNLLAGGGGILEIPTIGFSGLNVFHKQFWPFHFPFGRPGDQLWVPEDFRIIQSCQSVVDTASVLFENTISFRDGTTRRVISPSQMPLTLPKDSWAPEATMLPILSRLHLGIQSIVCNSDFSLWLVTLIHLNPVVMQLG